MWLLSTDRAELHFFNDPQDVPPPGICILSHTWGNAKDEQTFQDINKIREDCKATGKNPREFVSEKIRRCCELAEQDGYAWLWIDSCCIDKTSSAELSEAINSMFRYYSSSGVCYAYLADVPKDCSALDTSDDNHFRRSRWFTRGWTLQELIAPDTVVFFSRDWTFLGTKADLAEPLEKATRIPTSILYGTAQLSNFSVAQRMSWAAFRKTSRKEDEAYCLLGIFDINMPTLYGEGANAFRRLQEEIIRKSADTTIFAWNLWRAPMGDHRNADRKRQWSLLADRPRDFLGSGDIAFGPGLGQTDQRNREPQTYKDPMTFSLTPHGVLARVPSALIEDVRLIDLDWYIRLSSESRRIYLALVPSADRVGSRILWRIGGTYEGRHAVQIPGGLTVKWAVQELYLFDRGNDYYNARKTSFPCNRSSKAPFHFRMTGPRHLTITDVSNAGITWTGAEPAVLDFQSQFQQFHLTLGTCSNMACCNVTGSGVIHWIRACFGPSTNCSACQDKYSHSCVDEHIREELHLKARSVVVNRHLRGFSFQDALTCDTDIDVKISFTKHPWAATTLVLEDIEVDIHEEGISLKLPTTLALDPENNCLLLHTDNPLPIDIAAPPIMQDDCGRSVYLGSAALAFGQVIHPCKIVLQDGLPKVFVLDSDHGELEHYGYYYLLASESHRIPQIPRNQDQNTVPNGHPDIRRSILSKLESRSLLCRPERKRIFSCLSGNQWVDSRGLRKAKSTYSPSSDAEDTQIPSTDEPQIYTTNQRVNVPM